jgi:ribonuclease E
LVPSAETLGIGFLRKLSLETLKQKSKRVRGIVPVDVADYLLNRKRREIVDLEVRRDLTVEIEGARSMLPGDSDIIWRQ